MRTAAVVPAYNEIATIRDVYEGARSCVDRVYIVDDGSEDGTSTLAKDVLRHSRNRGKGCALRTGVRHALASGAEAIVTLDADGQHDPQEIPMSHLVRDLNFDRVFFPKSLHIDIGPERQRHIES